jgi:hypothetical protein
MPGSAKFEIRYVSPAIVRSDDHVFALQHVDEQGELTFFGLESGHASGGMLYFPTVEEWDSFLPKRGGQRSRILERLFDYASRKDSHLGFIVPSLLEPGYLARWPKERDLLRRDPSPITPEQLKKAVLEVDLVNSSFPHPSVPRAAFKRNFRAETIKGDVITNVVLCSDGKPGRDSRIEIQFLAVEYNKIPAAFEGLFVEDVTDAGAPDAETAAILAKWKGSSRLYRVRAMNGPSGYIISPRCAIGADEAPPGSPSMFPRPG